MKTIEERIGLCSHCLNDTDRYCHKECSLYSKYQGATEQKVIDDEERDTAVYNLLILNLDAEKELWLEKACKWLMEHISGDVDCNDDGEPLAESFIEERKLAIQIVDDFRKTMEE